MAGNRLVVGDVELKVLSPDDKLLGAAWVDADLLPWVQQNAAEDIAVRRLEEQRAKPQ